VGPHHLLADEPLAFGGLGGGPSLYDYLSVALGACTSMTFQVYAERKGWQLPPFVVEVRHGKVHAKDCVDCVEGETGLIDRFERLISFESDLGEEIRANAVEIAGKCPVHRALERSQRTWHSSSSPHARLILTRPRMSGCSCARLGSRTECSTRTRLSSRLLARPGAGLWRNPPQS
jgi:uncharacterized OsmC-like protein